MCSDLGFSDLDRLENVRRIAHVARLFQQTGHIVLVATISPLAAQRELARGIIGAGFLETFISASAELCSQRDPKGMYAQARLGKIAQFTGVSSAYEVPANPDLLIETARCRVESAVATIILRLGKRVRTESVKKDGTPKALGLAHGVRHLNHYIRLRHRDAGQDQSFRLLFPAQSRPFDGVRNRAADEPAHTRPLRAVKTGYSLY